MTQLLYAVHGVYSFWFKSGIGELIKVELQICILYKTKRGGGKSLSQDSFFVEELYYVWHISKIVVSIYKVLGKML